MPGELIRIDPALLGLIKGSFNESGLPMPFVREIFLLETHVAGTAYQQLEKVEDLLQSSCILIFKREVENRHDALAISIHTETGHKLGYVPRRHNEIPARLMDAGKLIFGRLASKELQGNWLNLKIQLFMRDF